MEQNKVSEQTHTNMVTWFSTNGGKGKSVKNSVSQMALEKLDIYIQVSGL